MTAETKRPQPSYPELFDDNDCALPDNERIIQQHQHTLGHIDCPACDDARDATLRFDPDSLLQEKFSSAAAIWLATRKPHLKERPFYMLGHHIDQLSKFLGEVPMAKMHIGHLRKYQAARQANEYELPDGTKVRPWKKPCAFSIINHELSVVQSILKRAGIWKKRFEPHYEPIPKASTRPQKVMTDEQEGLLFEIATSSPEWELACIVATITNNSSAAGTELRHLRLDSLFLDNPYPTFLIPAEFCKSDNRGRRIYVNPTCMEAFRAALARAKKLGSTQPDHYLFPKRSRRNHYDPYRPASASWLRNQFKEMREAAGVPWLTPHCLRHQFITRLFEQGHSEHDIQAITGQLSKEALKMYSHNRIERQSRILLQDDPANRKRMETARIGATRKHA